MQVEKVWYDEYRIRKAAKFYQRNRETLNSKAKMESVTHMDGYTNMDLIRDFCKVDSGTGYKYCQKKFMTLCSILFDVPVLELREFFKPKSNKNVK